MDQSRGLPDGGNGAFVVMLRETIADGCTDGISPCAEGFGDESLFPRLPSPPETIGWEGMALA